MFKIGYDVLVQYCPKYISFDINPMYLAGSEDGTFQERWCQMSSAQNTDW